MLTVYSAADLAAEWITPGTFKYLETSCDATKHRCVKKMPMLICQYIVQSGMHKKSSAPNGRTRLPSWREPLYVLGCAIIYLGLFTATPVTHAMQRETLTVRSSHAVCDNHCEIALCRLCVPSFRAQAGPSTAVVQWVWYHPMETLSPDTESAPVKCTIIPGARSLTTTVPGNFPLSAKRIINRLYLHNKSLLC